MEKVFSLLKYIEKNGYEAFIVGGYVRDLLLGKFTNDIDICTSARYDELVKILPALKYKDFFSSSLIIDSLNIDITTYRVEDNYDGRKPLNIKYTDKLTEDLYRRDFTINTILLDKDGNYIDLLNGINDLNKCLIKTVYDSYKSITDDNLRILRAIRFATTLNFELDDNLKKAIMENAHLVQNLSIYRVRSELDKILKSSNFNYGINLIKYFHLDKYLNISFFKKINYCDNLIGLYAQMNINIDNFFTKNELKRINILKENLNKNLDQYDLYKLGYENVLIIDQVLSKNLIKTYNRLPIKSSKELSISFDDIKDIINKKNVPFEKIKSKIIEEIVYGNIKNVKDDIVSFIVTKY